MTCRQDSDMKELVALKIALSYGWRWRGVPVFSSRHPRPPALHLSGFDCFAGGFTEQLARQPACKAGLTPFGVQGVPLAQGGGTLDGSSRLEYGIQLPDLRFLQALFFLGTLSFASPYSLFKSWGNAERILDSLALPPRPESRQHGI